MWMWSWNVNRNGDEMGDGDANGNGIGDADLKQNRMVLEWELLILPFCLYKLQQMAQEYMDIYLKWQGLMNNKMVKW